MGISAELLKEADAIEAGSPSLASLIRRAAAALEEAGSLSSMLPPEMAALFSSEEPIATRGPAIQPNCCADGHGNIYLAMTTREGRSVPSNPEAWYLSVGTPPMGAVSQGETIRSSGGYMMLLIRYCPYCGAKLDPSRSD